MGQVLLLGTGSRARADARCRAGARRHRVDKGQETACAGQIAQGAKQGKGARFNRNRRHDVCSFIKLSYKYLFQGITQGKCSNNHNIFAKYAFQWWWSATLSRIGHRKGHSSIGCHPLFASSPKED
jgi:hypothetical protein